MKNSQNKSILSFFKKSTVTEESIFVPGKASSYEQPMLTQRELPTTGKEDDYVPLKRRRLDASENKSKEANTVTLDSSRISRKLHNGPFAEDSDSELDTPFPQKDTALILEATLENPWTPKKQIPPTGISRQLKSDDKSIPLHTDGESSMYRTFESEFLQSHCCRLKHETEADISRPSDMSSFFIGSKGLAPSGDDSTGEGSGPGCCPICGVDLGQTSLRIATAHVNACLDDQPGSLDEGPAGISVAVRKMRDKDEPDEVENSHEDDEMLSDEQAKESHEWASEKLGTARFLGDEDADASSVTTPHHQPGSAFSKLMLGRTEDAVWSHMALNESASKGKPAIQRTCPFYKIIPGFSISVDAFRYGAVSGCQAYFLSHFHSDHYIGLTRKWCHGPIYCSRVTGSLVKSQLGTASRWVVELDFDEPSDIPGTGARVIMIPANHCPGSSLFLFEKKFDNGQFQRILHCGDFRACHAQVSHPLLQPYIVDSISGIARQQKIDVCYLDTTYLNPKYSFPPQEDVIKTCAQICEKLSQSLQAGQEAEWDRLLLQRGGRTAAAVATAPADSVSILSLFTKDGTAAKSTENLPAQEKMTSKTPEKPSVANAFSILGKAAVGPICRNRLLVVCGTYSIGKERICVAIAKALHSKIYASASKARILAQLGDPELTAMVTSNAAEAQVHMQMIMDIRPDTLIEYLHSHRPHFSHIVGFRPSGWNYRPAATVAGSSKSGSNEKNNTFAKSMTNAATMPAAVPIKSILHSSEWRSRFSSRNLMAQKGSNKEALSFGVPYSEHSSFRELAIFVMALRIERVIPTVNVGSEQSRHRMKGWIDRWIAERKRGGILCIRQEEEDAAPTPEADLWGGNNRDGGVAYW